MKAIVIARVSTQEQLEMGSSLPAQIARVEKYCQNKKLEIIKTFSFDESAYKNDRTEFDKILDYVIEQPGKIAVCTDKVDRLSRNMFDKRVSILYEKALNDQIELHFVSDGQIINSSISAAEKFQFGISLGLAKYYSDAISDNVKRANEQKLRSGECTGKAPFGYKNITKPDGKKDVVVDEHNAYIVQQAFAWYATGTYSLELVSQKIKSDFGISWTKSYIDKMFNNPFYHGVMLVKGQLYPHRYTPIISKSVHDQVQQVKKGFNKSNRYKYAGKSFIYRGLIRCGDCGLSITPETHKGYAYYHCTQYNGKHGGKWLREEEITRQFGELFKKLQFPEEVLQRTLLNLEEVHKNKVEFHNEHFDKLNAEHKEANKMMDNLYLDKLKNKISEEQYNKFYQKLSEQISDVNHQLSKLQEAQTNYYATAKYLLELSFRAYDLFMSSEVEQKRQLIKLLLLNVTLKGKTLVWELHKPFDLIVNCSDGSLWRPQGESNSYSRRERAVS